ncbi:glycoside hydrolase family 16 protein [Coniophora puteana RWD-64-598 SS2]|uniref:Glycoside hydrolase family 16 protein n=1 Tax=Coniophora puteana (strain RWD-64-598) TaxID=741705 RepID=A0A5M3MBQ4_CONPW|nr:glycoside hydrolase family 16 protein [Coniophora puteana RWD-64-598 SS2]EIW76065.1 glycoside hydrolase family 16 protein [Coniophora puteana RWD-64-598 SS2]
MWTPPSVVNSPGGSSAILAVPPQKLKPSTRLPAKLNKEDKPWIGKPHGLDRLSWWLTVIGLLLGVLGGAALCFFGYESVDVLPMSDLCLVMDDEFDSLDLTNNWSRDVELGGFGNGEFEMTTDSDSNSYVKNGQLYILPTLTSNSIDGGYSAVLNGASYNLPGCTADIGDTSSGNSTSSSGGGGAQGNACTAYSDSAAGTVINPVMSARLNTRGKKSIAYGRVEVRAKLPQGDWLWPAIWMLPEGNSSEASNSSSRAGVYGDWPMSGEIDIMEARGNLPSYPAQGSNYVRSSLNYGPFSAANTPTLYGWVTTKRGNYADGFHVYAFEWTDSWMRFYTDSRLQAMVNIKMTGSGGNGEDTYFFKSAGFPATAMNASSGYEVVVTDPWTEGSNAAPYDQQFYLIMDLAVGGISGWFPDNVGNKMWFDNSQTAMQEFAKAQSDWYATWPTNEDDLAFRIDYVKMWKLCGS